MASDETTPRDAVAPADAGGTAPAEATPGGLDLPAEMFRSGENPTSVTVPFEKQLVGTVFRKVQATTVNGRLVFEGDIMLGRADQVLTAAVPRGIGRTGEGFRWPDGVVPWVAETALEPLVRAAIRHWEERTPIRFPPRTAADPDFLSFKALDGCWSSVGRQGGEQEISLGAGCGLGAAIHEIGHALGLWHEQSREDRDQHIEVLLQNVIPQFQHNFDQHVLDGDDLGHYDFNSIMHYPATAFSRNGQPTLRARGGQPIGQRQGLSAGDTAAIRILYPTLDWGSVPQQGPTG
ncbi:MAG TPA: M12 family metallopeptidase [Roseomonas sp.]|jgi:hypothetical protein